MNNKQYIKALDTKKNDIRLISLNIDGFACTIDTQQLSREEVVDLLSLIASKKVVAHNTKFDISSLMTSYGVNALPLSVSDTMLMAGLVDNATATSSQKRELAKEYKKPLSLEALCKRYLNVELSKYQQRSDFSGSLNQDQIEYAIKDVRFLPVLSYQLKVLIKKMGMCGILQIEAEFLKELILIESAGVPVNISMLTSRLEKHVQRHDILLNYFKDLKINQNSHIQCTEYLNSIGIEVSSTKAEVLVNFTGNAFVDNLIEYRTIKKEIDLIKSYLEVDNRRLYTSFSQIRSSSGRMSSSNPNIQQVPKAIKKDGFYTSKQGKVLLRADFSQIELTIVAVYAQDPTMISLFNQGIDIHKYTASLISGIPYDQIRDDSIERDRAKPVNFGFIYGLSPESFVRKAKLDYKMDISIEEAHHFRNTFLKTFSGIKRWHNETAIRLKRSHIMQQSTLLGRKMLVDKFTDAVNYPIQGTGADMLKAATVIFGKSCRNKNIDAQIINLIHDEVIVEASLEHQNRATEILKLSMEKVANDLMGAYFKTNVIVEIINQ